ncbi:hypothetical protein K438DRAFT_1529247, partial [Mycena galopus ATCC 62051]
RPATWSARIWFRADGTPRSKVRGLVITSVLSGLLYATWSTLLVVEALDYEHYLLSTLVHIQRVDYDYSTVPFAHSYAASVEYFEEMCAYLAHREGDVSPEMLERFFADKGHRRTRAHLLITAAAATVHDIIARSKGADPAETAAIVLDVMDQALMELLELAEDIGED